MPKSESPIFNISPVSLSARAIRTELAALLAVLLVHSVKKYFLHL